MSEILRPEPGAKPDAKSSEIDRPRVHFVVAGTQKGGTTSLRRYLAEHPQVDMLPKEGHYFDAEKVGGVADVAYHAGFRQPAGGAVRGDCTPIYMFWPGAMEQVSGYNPLMKVIVLLRNPAMRAYSHWHMQVSRGREHRAFRDAIQDELANKPVGIGARWHTYVSRGFYAWQIERIARLFPSKQTMFVKSEEFFSDGRRVMRRVTGFLEIDPYQCEMPIYNKGNYDEDMASEDKALLVAVFRNDIERIMSLLGWDCRDWLT